MWSLGGQSLQSCSNDSEPVPTLPGSARGETSMASVGTGGGALRDI